MSWPCRVCNLATWNDRSTCRGCDQAKPSTAKTKTAPGKGKGQQKTSSASVDVSASSKSRVAIIKEEQTIAEARDRPLGEQSLEVLKAALQEAKTSRAALSVTTPVAVTQALENHIAALHKELDARKPLGKRVDDLKAVIGRARSAVSPKPRRSSRPRRKP